MNPFGDEEITDVNPFGDIEIKEPQPAPGNSIIEQHQNGNSIIEQHQNGTLNKRKQALFSELQNRAKDIGAFQAFLIGTGKGFVNIARGLGLIDKATETESLAMDALREERPYTTGGGELVGESAPFLIPGTMAGKIASLPLRVLASGAVGGIEGGVVQGGRGEDVAEGIEIGAGIGMGAEVLLSVVGRLGSKIFRKVMGKSPKGAIIDLAGNPTPEFKKALDMSGIEYDELVDAATEMVKNQKAGANPKQVSRAALFKQEGVQPTKGEITKDFGQLTTEQRLFESSGEAASEPFRQFKLKQSESIKESLRKNIPFEPDKEETGQLIHDAITGRKKLLRTQKNALYKEAAEAAEDIGGIPLISDGMKDAIPDTMTMERLDILDETGVKQLDKWLTRFGIKEPTDEMLKQGFKTEPLTIENFELFRQGLNNIGKSSDAINVAIGPIRNALDVEIDEFASLIPGNKIPKDVFNKLKEARKTVRTLGTEFSPQSIIGKIIDTKKDGVTQITEASKVYDLLARKSQPVESVRKTLSTLKKSGDKGKQAISSLQATVILDLIDAGFGTESRKISGIKVFNPIAFKRRLNAIGSDKVNAIFSNEKDILKKLSNIEKISTELIPPSGAQPKGSATVILDLANKLGIASLSTKIPGGALIIGGLQKIAEPIKIGATVSKALKADPDIMVPLIEKQFPGIASAMLIPAISKHPEDK